MNLSVPRILVLNAGYEPLGLTSVKRAIILVQSQAALTVIESQHFLRTPSSRVPVPSVIRITRMIRRPPGRLSPSRRNVLKRDGYTCQYCGLKSAHLTIDHVLPRSRGGRDTWENLVAACHKCNVRKGDRTPSEAKMPLLRQPKQPGYLSWITFEIRQIPAEWRQFLPLKQTSRVYAD